MQLTDISGTVTLHNGIPMPYFGLGVYQSKDGDEVINAVRWAIEDGYRHIDTAAIYKNESGVGEGVRSSGVDRRDVFITSKVWNSDQGFDSTLAAFEKSCERLGTNYLDLYLVHWPVTGKYKHTWRALEKLYKDGRVRAIGVSNFLQQHLEDLLEESEIVPMVNQLEFHPRLVQQDLIDFCHARQIRYEAWSPLMQGEFFDTDLLDKITRRHGKSIAQVMLRWALQKDVIVIPKSSNQQRIHENGDIFDFELSSEEMAYISGLDQGKRIGPDPGNFDF